MLDFTEDLDKHQEKHLTFSFADPSQGLRRICHHLLSQIRHKDVFLQKIQNLNLLRWNESEKV